LLPAPTLPGGRLARIDLAVPDIRWGIEVDLHPEHRSIEGDAGHARRRRIGAHPSVS